MNGGLIRKTTGMNGGFNRKTTDKGPFSIACDYRRVSLIGNIIVYMIADDRTKESGRPLSKPRRYGQGSAGPGTGEVSTL